MTADMNDLARYCGVSITTVSRALRNKGEISKETREKILAAAKELNYMPNLPARILAGGHSNTVGLIVADNSNPYYAELIHGAEDCAKDYGYGVILYNTNEDDQLELKGHQMLLENRVGGLLITSITSGKQPLVELNKRKIPFVLLNRFLEDYPTDWVRSNNELGAYQITKHLCSKGYKRILHITGSETISSVRERQTGYINALKENGCDVDPSLIYRCDLNLESGYKSTLKAFRELDPAPSAIFAYSDLLAIGALKALHELDMKVPADVALAGYDNIEYSPFIEPPLTTVDQFAYEIGSEGMKILIEKINLPEDEEWQPKQIILDPELCVRESSG